jgi:hypothetical protein
MAASKKPDSSISTKDKPAEIATFKNSLRVWQAQWKAQKAAQEAAFKDSTKSFPKTEEV